MKVVDAGTPWEASCSGDAAPVPAAPVQGWSTQHSAVLDTPVVAVEFRPLVAALLQAFVAGALVLDTVYTYEILSSMVTPPLAQQLDDLMAFLEGHGHVSSGGGNGSDETITFHTRPVETITSL